jgi:hypothetical protein
MTVTKVAMMNTGSVGRKSGEKNLKDSACAEDEGKNLHERTERHAMLVG